MGLATPPPPKRQPVLHPVTPEGADCTQTLIDDFFIDLTTYLTRHAAFENWCRERKAA